MTPSHPALEVRDLVVHYSGSKTRAVNDVAFSVERRRTLAIVGPSGAGKTTLLRAIAGLTRVESGSVSLGERDLNGIVAQDRRIAMVFQSDALFPHLSVRQNLTFALRDRSRTSTVEELARSLEIAHHLDRKPGVLSGGERQRVSIARAVLSEPAVLLLDEPLAHLDPELRARVRNELLGVRERFEGPIVYVTHDHAEALAIADELLVLMNGAVEDAGDPQRVYDAPATVRSAAFLGERPMNILERDADTVLGIRPEHIRIADSGALEGVVFRRELTGADAYLYVRTSAGTVVSRVSASTNVSMGDRVSLAFDEKHVRKFDRASGKTLQ